jgi:carbon storage regulator
VLVLTRKLNESIVIDGVITITVLEVSRNGSVRLGIEAPRHHQVYRQELALAIQAENRSAAALGVDQAAALNALLGGTLPATVRETSAGTTLPATTVPPPQS